MNGENKPNGVMWLQELSRFWSPRLLSVLLFDQACSSLLEVNLQLMEMFHLLHGEPPALLIRWKCFGLTVSVCLLELIYLTELFDSLFASVGIRVLFRSHRWFILLFPRLPAPLLLNGYVLIGQFDLVVFDIRKAEFCLFGEILLPNWTFISFPCRPECPLEPVTHSCSLIGWNNRFVKLCIGLVDAKWINRAID